MYITYSVYVYITYSVYVYIAYSVYVYITYSVYVYIHIDGSEVSLTYFAGSHQILRLKGGSARLKWLQ